MGFELADIRRVLDAFEKSSWEEVHLAADGFELHLVASSASPSGDSPSIDQHSNLSDNSTGADPSSASPPPITASATATGTASETASAGAPAVSGESAGHGPLPDDQTVTISSPSLGIFWRSPRPGAPPFVAVGDEVTPDTTVCIVEVMKLMNHVKAEVTGRVAEVLVENGRPVEQGQALFTVVPAGT